MAKRAMKLDAAADIVRSLSPEHLAEPWDKVGLHVGEQSWPVRRALLCIDLTEQVMDEAIAEKATLIVSYHPPIFHPLTSLTDATAKERIMLRAIQHRIGVYSPHTALDAAADGMTDWLCHGLQKNLPATAIRPIVPRQPKSNQHKVVVFVPGDHADSVRRAMGTAGAGAIGNYRDCSYNMAGFGMFTPTAGANPAIGKLNKAERVDEIRIEMVCETSRLAEVVAALRQSHPYEEPAFDLMALTPAPQQAHESVGSGRLVTLSRPVSAKTLATRVKKHLGQSKLRLVTGGEDATITTIAVCPGAGGSLFEKFDADAYLTGEMQHHQVLELKSRGKNVLLAGHTNTERPYLPIYRGRLAGAGGDRIDWVVSDADQCPWSLA